MTLGEMLESVNPSTGQPYTLFDFDYKSYYTGNEKTAFENKIIEHFRYRQIGAETIGRFKHNFKVKLTEIMPYYYQLYKSVELMGDPDDPDNPIKPLENYNLTETYTEHNEGKTENKNKLTNNLLSTNGGSDQVNQYHLDTPQSISTTMGHTENGVFVSGYMSDANETFTKHGHTIRDTGESETEDKGSVEGDTTHTLKRYGNIGVTTYANLLEGYRKTFINIDKLIIDELSECFLAIY